MQLFNLINSTSLRCSYICKLHVHIYPFRQMFLSTETYMADSMEIFNHTILYFTLSFYANRKFMRISPRFHGRSTYIIVAKQIGNHASVCIGNKYIRSVPTRYFEQQMISKAPLWWQPQQTYPVWQLWKQRRTSFMDIKENTILKLGHPSTCLFLYVEHKMIHVIYM